MHHPHYPPTRGRLPIVLILIVALVALIVIVAAGGWAAWQWYILDQTLPTVASVLRVAFFASPLIAGGVGLFIAYRRWASVELLKADRVVKLTKAQNQRLPDSVTTLNYHDSSRPIIQPPTEEPLPELLPAPELASVPTFGDLLNRGSIGSGQKLILGFESETGQAIEGSWEDLFSCSLGGLQGSGKTWAAVYLLAQSALMAGRIVICDPHAGDRESLAARVAPLQNAMLCDVADDDKSILAALKMADDKLQRRKKGHTARWPIVVAVDEFLSLRRGPLADLLPPLIEDFSTEGRKLNVHILLLSQRWDKAAIGDFRNTLSSSYVFRIRPDEARMMTGLRAASLPADTLQLPPATAYLLDTRGQIRKVTIPRMTPADVGRVAVMLDQVNRPMQPIGFRPPAGITPSALLSTHPAPDSNGTATGQQRDSKNELLSTAPGSAKPLPPETARAAALFLAGNEIPAIVRELRGIEPAKGGRAYRDAAKEISELLRSAMGGQQL